MVNVKLDYLPKVLIQSNDCTDRCSQVLVAKVIGEHAARIKSTYIPGSRYAFTVEIDFDRPYMSKFTAEISVNPSLGSRYFGSVSIASKLSVEVNPAFLAFVGSHSSTDTLS